MRVGWGRGVTVMAGRGMRGRGEFERENGAAASEKEDTMAEYNRAGGGGDVRMSVHANTKD